MCLYQCRLLFDAPCNNVFSLRSIISPCSIPFKCKRPWIKSWSTLNSLALRILMKISPEFSDKENESTLVTLSRFRYMEFKLLESASAQKTSESSYFLPRTLSLIFSNWTPETLLRVVFFIANCKLKIENCRKLSFSARELANLSDLAHFNEFGGNFLFLQEGDGLGTASVSRGSAFGITLGADTRENSGG